MFKKSVTKNCYVVHDGELRVEISRKSVRKKRLAYVPFYKDPKNDS